MADDIRILAPSVPVEQKTNSVSGKAQNSVSNFLAEIRATGIARPNRFEVIIQTPADGNSVSQLVGMYADATILPGKRLLTGRQQLFGTPEYFPIGVDYGGDNLNITFLVDREMLVKDFFDGWMSAIVRPSQSAQAAWGSTNYRSEYVGSIIINQLDESDNVMYSVKVYDAFPTAINPMQLDNSLGSTVHRLSVSFNYRYWETNTVSGGSNSNRALAKENTDPSQPTLPVKDTNTNQSEFSLTPQQQAQNVLQPGYNPVGTGSGSGSRAGEFFLIN